MSTRRGVGALLTALAVAGPLAMRAASADRAERREQSQPETSALRAVVLMVGEEDPDIARRLRDLGANTVVTFARPSAAASAAARAAGLRYIPFLSTSDVDRLTTDPEFLVEIQSVPDIAGFHYRDEEVLEGYTSPASQERAYSVLKSLFPGALVLFATRLDPIATDPAYLDGFFRPEFSDFVTPYFYPVGTTVLGAETEDDPWEERLLSLLTPLAARTPSGKGVLPVLQGFEQSGFPVSSALVRRQSRVYGSVWPGNRNFAAFWWGGGTAEPLSGLSQEPALRSGFQQLFRRSALPRRIDREDD